MSRWEASAISKVKRLLATRSRLVERVALRMFTWASESEIVMSESSRARSSASTWMLTRNVDCELGAHSTSISRSGWFSRLAALVQLRRCTETPPPLVTKPRIGSGGTGVQHLASLTHTSSTPLMITPESVLLAVARERRVMVTPSARSSAAPSSPPCRSMTRRTTACALRLFSPTAA